MQVMDAVARTLLILLRRYDKYLLINRLQNFTLDGKVAGSSPEDLEKGETS